MKTCTNCIKQGQTCDYNRIPQKRGPSKGYVLSLFLVVYHLTEYSYIKDLSERVHHLEDSLANASNYRSSLDAGTYVDTAFSPEEDLALRRQTSISQQKSPFADFTRDRFPSVGGWNNQLPTPTRDRASIAIPPDQLPSSQPVSARSSKLWWAPERLPSAKVKTPAEIEETAKILENVNMDHYYEIVHAQCSVLPDKDRTLAILEKASPEYIIAFATAINLLPQKKNDAAPAQLKTKEELETFIEEKARLKWRDKSNIDNLVLLWSTLFLHIVYIHDMQAHAKQNALVSIELDLISDFVKLREFLTHDSQYEFEWIRSFNMAALFARLNAVSQGDSRDPLPSYLSSYLNYTDWQVVAPRIRYTVMMTDIIQVALSMLPKDGVSFTSENLEGFARMQSSNMRAWLRSAEISAQEPFVKEIDAFVTLLSLRFISQGARPAVVGPVCNLVEAIRVNSLQTGEEQYLFNPLSFHTISLATTALLELQSCNFDDQQGQPLIETATSDMMKQLAELEARRAQLEGGAGGLFWAKALTNFAQDKLKQSVRAFPSPEDKGEDDVVPEMARILHQGYLFPLLNTISK